ncbi:hypothetical protein LCGC14_2729340, partial [marine sediment metagenome]
DVEKHNFLQGISIILEFEASNKQYIIKRSFENYNNPQFGNIIIKLVEYNPDRLQRVKQQGLDKIIQTLQQYADIAVRETGQKQCNNCYNDGSFCPTKSIIPCPYWKPNKLKAP